MDSDNCKLLLLPGAGSPVVRRSCPCRGSWSKGWWGVVGPACSDAAKGALQVLGPAGVPVVSFAATAQELGSEKYPTFFRTA